MVPGCSAVLYVTTCRKYFGSILLILTAATGNISSFSAAYRARLAGSRCGSIRDVQCKGSEIVHLAAARKNRKISKKFSTVQHFLLRLELDVMRV